MTARYDIEEVIQYRLVKVDDRGIRQIAGVFSDREEAEEQGRELAEWAAERAERAAGRPG